MAKLFLQAVGGRLKLITASMRDQWMVSSTLKGVCHTLERCPAPDLPYGGPLFGELSGGKWIGGNVPVSIAPGT